MILLRFGDKIAPYWVGIWFSSEENVYIHYPSSCKKVLNLGQERCRNRDFRGKQLHSWDIWAWIWGICSSSQGALACLHRVRLGSGVFLNLCILLVSVTVHTEIFDSMYILSPEGWHPYSQDSACKLALQLCLQRAILTHHKVSSLGEICDTASGISGGESTHAPSLLKKENPGR